MSEDMEKVWAEIEEKAFQHQTGIEEDAVRLFKLDPKNAQEFLTKYCLEVANNAVLMVSSRPDLTRSISSAAITNPFSLRMAPSLSTTAITFALSSSCRNFEGNRCSL